jgi:hypothetical protein
VTRPELAAAIAADVERGRAQRPFVVTARSELQPAAGVVALSFDEWLPTARMRAREDYTEENGYSDVVVVNSRTGQTWPVSA